MFCKDGLAKFYEAKFRYVRFEWFARLARNLDFRVLWKSNYRCGGEKMFLYSRKSSNFNNKEYTRSTSIDTIHTNDKDIKVFEKASLIDLDKWPSLFLNILSVLLLLSCICVQRWKFLQWIDVKVFLEKWNPTRKSQIDWPLTFGIKDQYTASFYRSRINNGPESLKTQNLYSSCNRKHYWFLSQSEFDPREIDLTLYVNLYTEILFQYQYVLQSERMDYGIIKRCLRKSSAYRSDITKGKEQGLNRNDVTWTLVNLKN